MGQSGTFWDIRVVDRHQRTWFFHSGIADLRRTQHDLERFRAGTTGRQRCLPQYLPGYSVGTPFTLLIAGRLRRLAKRERAAPFRGPPLKSLDRLPYFASAVASSGAFSAGFSAFVPSI